MATLADLLADCRSHLDEPTAQEWSDVELCRWINEGLRDIARRSETLQAIKVYDIEGGKLQYDAPQDQLRIYRVEFHQTSSYVVTLEYQPLANMDDIWYTSRTIPGATPFWWSFWGFPSDQDRSQIYLYPAPSASIAQGLWVFYYRLPRTLQLDSQNNNSAIADIAAGWEDLVPLYCEMVARRKDNDRRWKEAAEIYEQRLSEFIAVSRHWSDQETFVSGRGNGTGLPAWLVGGGSDWY